MAAKIGCSVSVAGEQVFGSISFGKREYILWNMCDGDSFLSTLGKQKQVIGVYWHVQIWTLGGSSIQGVLLSNFGFFPLQNFTGLLFERVETFILTKYHTIKIQISKINMKIIIQDSCFLRVVIWAHKYGGYLWERVFPNRINCFSNFH